MESCSTKKSLWVWLLLELSRRSMLFQVGKDVAAFGSLFREAYSCKPPLPPPASATSSSGPFSGESSLVRENADRNRCKNKHWHTHR